MSVYIQLLSGHVHEVVLKPDDTVREIELQLYDFLQTHLVTLSRLQDGEYITLSDSLTPGETYYAIRVE